MPTEENTRVNYIKANANANASANARNEKCFISLLAIVFAHAFAFHMCEPKQRKGKCKNRFHRFHDTMARAVKLKARRRIPFKKRKWRSVTKYRALYDKRCADKLKKTLAWKYKQQIQKWISNCLQYKLTFFVALNTYFFRPLSTLYTETAAKSRLIAAKGLPSSAILEKVWLSLTAPTYLAFLEFAFDVWTSFSFCICICIARGNQAWQIQVEMRLELTQLFF